MNQDATYPYRKDIDPFNIPEFTPPERLRPCCVFGMDVKVSMVNIPVPIYQIVNVTEKDRLGPHTYDAGFFGGYGTDRNVSVNERNGIIYTCRGGFIDTAHVRDYSDLTIFLFFEFFRNLGNPFDIELKGELGPRVITIDEFDVFGEKFERARVASLMAAWTAYQLSLWHEIAQWHGYREYQSFSEEPSAYSLEDAYSNMIGVNIACGLIYSGLLLTDNQYARNFDIWLNQTLDYLGAVSKKENRLFMKTVDQIWWNSNIRLPEKFFVLKRNYNMQNTQPPYLISKKNGLPVPEECPCSGEGRPETLTIKDEVYDRPISEWVHIKLYVEEKYRASFAPGSAFNAEPDAIVPAEFQAIADADKIKDDLTISTFRKN